MCPRISIRGSVRPFVGPLRLLRKRQKRAIFKPRMHYGSERALDDTFGISADSSHPRSPKSAGIVSEFCRIFLPLWHAFLRYKRHWQLMQANP